MTERTSGFVPGGNRPSREEFRRKLLEKRAEKAEWQALKARAEAKPSLPIEGVLPRARLGRYFYVFDNGIWHKEKSPAFQLPPLPGRPAKPWAKPEPPKPPHPETGAPVHWTKKRIDELQKRRQR